MCNLPGELNVFHLSSFERHFARLSASILYLKRLVFYQMCLINYKHNVIITMFGSHSKIWTLECPNVWFGCYGSITDWRSAICSFSDYWGWGACLNHKRELCDNIADADLTKFWPINRINILIAEPVPKKHDCRYILNLLAQFSLNFLILLFFFF